MADDIQRIGIDASDYIAKVQEIISANLAWKASNQGTLKSIIVDYNELGERVGTTIKQIINDTTILNAKFKDSAEGFELLGTSISQIAPKLKTANQAIKEHAASLSALKKIQTDIASQKDITKQQALSPIAFKAVKEDVSKAFGTIPGDAGIKTVQRLSAEFGVLASQIASGKISYKEFLYVLDAVKNKKLIVPNPAASKEVQDLTRRVSALGQALIDVNNKSKTAFDALGRNADKQIRENLANAKQKHLEFLKNRDQADTVITRAQIPTTFASVHKDVTDKFGTLRTDTSNVGDIQRIQTNMETVSKLLASGKVSYKDFLTQLDAVHGKQILPPHASEDVNKVRNALSQMGSAYESIGVRANAAGKVILTFQGALRLAVVQSMHAALARLINLFIESGKAALEFGTKVALIKTISQDMPSTADEWTASLRRLSDELGRPITEISAAGYQTISNQMAHGREETERFIRTSAEFARTVGTNASQGVDLLTTAVKGFGLGSGDSNRAAAIFFNTIDYGRVTAEQLNQTLGRTVPIAKDLNISAEEVAAAYSALTLRGFTGEQAGTRLTNLLLGFEKPSEAMKKFFKGFGADSGRAFLADVGGFENALKLIAKGASEGTLKVEELFPELRKLAGALGLINDGAKTYSEIFQHITNDTDRYNQAVKITNETPAKKFTEEFTKIQNIFTIDISKKLQEEFVAWNKLFGVFGGISNILKEVGSVALRITIIAAGWIAWPKVVNLLSIAFVTLSTASKTLWAVITGTTASLTAFGVAANYLKGLNLFSAFAIGFQATNEALKFLEGRYKQFLNTAAEKKKIELDLDLVKFNASLSQTTNNLTKLSTDAVNVFQRANDRINNALSLQAEKQKEILKDVADTAEASFKGLFSLLESGVKSIEDTGRRARDNANNIKKDIAEIRQEQSRETFQTNIEIIKAANEGGPPLSEAERQLRVKRANDLVEQAKNAFKESGEGKDISAFARAVGLLKEAERTIAEMTSGYIANHKAAQTILDVTKETNDEEGKLIVAFKGIAAALGDVKTNADAVRAIEEQRVRLLEQQESIQKRIAVEAAKQKADAETDLAKLNDLFKRFNEFSFLTPEGKAKTSPLVGDKPLFDNQKKFLESERDKLLKLYNDIFNQIDKVKSKISGSPFAGFNEKLGITEALQGGKLNEFRKALAQYGQEKINQGTIQSAQDEGIKTTAQLTDKNNKLIEQYKNIEVSTSKQKENLNAALGLIEKMNKALEGSKVLEPSRNPFDPFSSREVTSKAKPLSKLVGGLNVEDPSTTLVNLSRMKELFPSILEEINRPTPTKPFPSKGDQPIELGNEKQKLRDVINAFIFNVDLATNAYRKIAENQDLQSQIAPEINRVQANLSTLPEAITGSIGAFQKWSQTVTNDLPAIQAVHKQYVEAAQAAANTLANIAGNVAAKVPAAPATGEGKAEGGLIKYYGTGGNVFRPKGTDVIPAMLSPNEYVMPAKQTSMFLSELELMRKGIDPFSVRSLSYSKGGFIPQMTSMTAPIYKAQGGSTSNNNFGGITVHMNDNAKNPNVGINIGQQIKRELRRGNIKF